MSKVLVIKNADFYANRVDTVNIGPDVPCTGITLNQSSISITDTATVTPSDTTDSVLWVSSDEMVATVNGGVVTAVSNGIATITATCGNYSATCSVTVAMPIKIAKGNLIRVGTINGGTELTPAAECSTATNGIGYGSLNGLYRVANSAYSGDVTEIYPIIIPNGAKTISVSMSSNYASIIVYYNKNMPFRPDNTNWDVSTVLDGETPSGGTPWSISAWEYGDRTFTIPDIENVNSFTLGIYAKNATAYNNFTSDMVTYTFGYE